MSKKAIQAIRKSIAGLLVLAMMVGIVLQDGVALTVKAAGITVKDVAGYNEGAYVEWEPVDGADGYQVYVSQDNATWTLIDNELIREYPGYFRADALGLTAGKWYLKIEAAKFDDNKNKGDTVAEEVQAVEVTPHDRSGYAWVNGTSSGAYNEDGSLRANAQVIYITENTKDTVQLDVVTNSNGKTEKGEGLQAILNLYKKNLDSRPLDVRLIGNITDFSAMEGGDIVLSGAGDAANKRVSAGITIEGVGKDTVANGWGLRIKNASNVEVRNIGFMNCDSSEGDNVGLQQGNDHVWVHHCDMFYGGPGGDSDQAKGDGALDVKKSQWVTLSYNHFWDNGKCCLLGNDDGEDLTYCITYHHNWFDHSDSRHPRVRTHTVHIYNNYYDGNAKYGVGAALGPAALFVENNYFKNCPYPMLISMQGSDKDAAESGKSGIFSGEDGSIIKAYGNEMVGEKKFVPYSEDNTDFDAYVAQSRDEEVPSTVQTKQGGHTYSNFDTAADFYKYTPDAAADVPNIVMAGAGRVNGGDFTHTFTAADDTDSKVNQELKSKLLNYSSQLIAIGGIQGSSVEGENPEPDPGPGNNNESAGSTQIHDFTASGKESDFYTITGNLATGKGTVEYDGKTLTQCLKMESSTVISFTAPADGKLTLVFGGTTAASGKSVKITINGGKETAYKCDSNGILELDVEKGAVTVKKGDGINLFYMVYVPNSSGGNEGGDGEDATEYTITIDKADGSATTTLTIAKGSSITSTQLPTPTREGYTFTGWVDGSDKTVTLPYTPTANMTIKAKWEKIIEVDPNALYNMELISLDIPAKTYTSDFQKNGFVITAGEGVDQSVSVDVASKKTIGGTDYTGRLKTGGSGTKDYRSIIVTTEDAATLTMACIVATTNDECELGVATLNESGEFVEITTGITVDGKAAEKITLSGSNGNLVTVALPAADTYYIYSKGSTKTEGSLTGGVNFYAIKVEYANGVDPVFCEVTFNSMGGLSVASQRVLAGEACMEPVETLKIGYTFDGWCADSECTQKYDFSTPVMSKTTLYAKWLAGEPAGEYLVLDMKDLPVRDYSDSFTRNGFSFKATSSKNLSVDASAVTVDGVDYTQRLKLNGTGSTSDRNISFKIEADATLTLVAASGSSGTARALKVTDGTNIYDISDIDAAEKYTQKLTAGTWKIYSANNGVNIYYISVKGEGLKTQYTITIDKGDGSAATVKTVVEGTELTETDLPSTLTRVGYNFLGWEDENGEIVTVPYTPTKNTTITAKWEAKKQYTITIDKQDGTEAAVKTIVEGTALTETDLPATLTKEGYTFQGWVDENGDAITVPYEPAKSMTIRAKWQQIVPEGQYAITIDRLDGTTDPVEKVITAGTELTETDLPATLTKEGYTFQGWVDDEGNAITVPYAPTKSMTIRAKWEKIDAVSTPVATPGAGKVAKGTEVTLTCATEGAKIYYTWDGTPPTAESEEYNNTPIVINETMTIKAIAIKGENSSNVGEFVYTVDDENPPQDVTVSSPVASPAAGAVAKGTKISLTSDTAEAKIYYTTDKTEPTTESELYTEPIQITEAVTIKAIAVKEGCKDSTVVTFEYTLADSTVEQAKAPKATPGADTVSTRVTKGTEVKLSSVTTDAKIYYTTDGTIPTKASTLYEKAIVIEKDTVIKAIAVKEGFTDSAVATFTYKVLPDDVDYGDITPEDIEELIEKYEASADPNKTLIPNGLWIAGLSSEGYDYIGSAIRPEVRVYNKNVMLREKADYTISYKNNVKANADVDVNADQTALNRAKAPMVTVTGKGNYGGKEVAAFKILPIDISDDEAFEADEMSFDTANKAMKQVPVLYWNGKSLKKKTDYVVAGYYKQKDITDMVGTSVTSITEDGDYLVELEGKGNFTGHLKVEWHVDSSRKLISNATVKKIPDQEYTHGGARPLPEVSFKGTDLTLGSDYTVSYSNNEQPGVAYVIITGTGDYTGTKRIGFKVIGTPLKGVEVTGIEDRVYDGDEQEMDIDVLLDGAKLIEGNDYTVTYSNNVKVGKAVVTITGINAYSGVIKKNFRIKAYNVADDQVKGTSDITAKYMKGGAKPELHLTFEGMALREGVDYSVTYKNNKVYPVSAAKQPQLVIKGKGNFTGTRTVDFTIEAKTLKDVVCVVPDVAKNNAGKYINKPVLTDVDGKKLAANKDYEIVSYTAKGAELSKSGADLAVGDTITVELKGKGAYAGQSEAEAAYTVTYKVTEADFSKAKITIKPQSYTGKAVTLTQDDITVKVGGADVAKEDYEILAGSYINNVKKGTAQVTLVGKNGYGGAKTVKFKIGARKFEWVWRLFSK